MKKKEKGDRTEKNYKTKNNTEKKKKEKTVL